MNRTDDWPNKAIHVKQLADEVADLKAVLQDISRQIRRIERRVNFAMSNSKPAKPGVASTHRGGGATTATTLSATEANKTIEQLKEKLYQKQPIQPELRSMTVKHGLFPIARELGLTNTKLPPKDQLILTITTRLRQSAMLTENIRRLAGAEEAARKSHAKTPHRD